MRSLLTVPALVLALTGTASADTGETETTGQFLMSIPMRSMDTVIDYCSENAPAIRNDLLGERAGFLEKFTEAMKPMMDRFKDDPEFNAPVEERMRQDIADINARGLSILKQQDADTACRRVLANIQNATADDIRKAAEDAYQKFREAAAAQESQQP